MKTTSCNSYGVALQFDASDESTSTQLLEVLPYGTQLDSPCDVTARRYALPPATSLELFSRDVMLYVANSAPHRVFVHAGVVGWRGRALLLPGQSFAGKSTLTAALVRAGATYYSDEYALVDEDGWVHPYARDLRMREPGEFEQTCLPVSSLGGHVGVVPLRVAQVVFATYAKGSAWTPKELTPGFALLELLRHAIPVQRTPARVLSTLDRMLDGARAWAAERPDADVTARVLLASMDEQLMARPACEKPDQS